MGIGDAPTRCRKTLHHNTRCWFRFAPIIHRRPEASGSAVSFHTAGFHDWLIACWLFASVAPMLYDAVCTHAEKFPIQQQRRVVSTSNGALFRCGASSLATCRRPLIDPTTSPSTVSILNLKAKPQDQEQNVSWMTNHYNTTRALQFVMGTVCPLTALKTGLKRFRYGSG